MTMTFSKFPNTVVILFELNPPLGDKLISHIMLLLAHPFSDKPKLRTHGFLMVKTLCAMDG